MSLFAAEALADRPRVGLRDPVNRPRVYYPDARVVLHSIFEGLDLGQPVSFPTIPTAIDLVINGYDEPDSWSIEFDQKDLPISPDLFKTCAAEVYLYDKGALLVDEGAVEGSGLRQLQSGGIDLFTFHEPVITGLADSLVVDYDASGRTVRIEGRDYTAVFIETTWRHDGKGHPDPIPTGRLDEVLERLMREVDRSHKMHLELRLPKDLPPDKLPDVGRSTTRVIRDGFHAGGDANYWSVMSRMATQYGFLCFVEGTRLVLTTAGAAYRKGADVFEVEWGRNLEHLSLERKMGKERAPQIEVRSYDDDAMKTRVARWPPDKQPTAKATPNKVAVVSKKGKVRFKSAPRARTPNVRQDFSLAGKDTRPDALGANREERRVFRVYGVKDERDLLRLARSAHEELGRGEFKISFSTADMADRRGLRFLTMHAGSAVQPIFDPLWEELRTMDEPTRRQAFLRGKGFTEEVATFLAKNYTAIAAFREPMYLREARVRWSADDGFSLEGEIVNFIRPAREGAA